MLFSWVFPVAGLALTAAVDYKCRGMNGQAVDWFAAYKLPNTANFYYTDNKSPDWTLSDKSLNESDSAIGRTLSLLWNAKQEAGTLMGLYNDGDPTSNKSTSYRAHMKGALVFDDFTGFWLIHSVPNFVDVSLPAYSYPASGIRNGQSFLCLSLSTAFLTEIGRHLELAQPTVYFSQIPPSFNLIFPDIGKALRMDRLTGNLGNGDYSINQEIHTLDGEKMTLFAQNRKFEKDLYSDFVSPVLNTDLFVESWLNGAAADLPTVCSVRRVYNIDSITLPANTSFTSSKDHSKWAVGGLEQNPVVCIGDLNRQVSQTTRGGGTVCVTQNKNLWKLYRNAVDTVRCCGDLSIARDC